MITTVVKAKGRFFSVITAKVRTGEALLLWFIDTIDSKFTVLGETLEGTAEGSFTQIISVMDKMRFYKHNFKK